jgi:hypothetical protein
MVFLRVPKYKHVFERLNMASRITYRNYDCFYSSLPDKSDIKIAVKSLCLSYKNGAISETIFNQVMRALIATAIENDITDKLLTKSHRFDEKMNRHGRLSI